MNTPLIRLDSSATDEHGVFDDEDTSDLAPYEISNRPLQLSFRTSKFNKKLYPSGFNLNLARTESFDRNEGSGSKDSHRGCVSATRTAPPGRQKTSFMFWAKGFEAQSEFDHHRKTISEAVAVSPFSAGGWQKSRKCSSFPSGISLASGATSARSRTSVEKEADDWLQSQIINEMTDADFLTTAPNFQPQDHVNTGRRGLIRHSDASLCSSHQLSFSDIDTAKNRSHSRKVVANTSYTGFKPPNVKGPELNEFIRYNEWASRSLDRRNLSGDAHEKSFHGDMHEEKEVERLNLFRSQVTRLESEHEEPMGDSLEPSLRENPRQQCSMESSMFSNLLPDDSIVLKNYGMPEGAHFNGVSGVEGGIGTEGSQFSFHSNGVRFGHSNIIPLAGRVILLVYRYKAMIVAQSSVTFDKPALMLDIKADVKYSVIMRLISDFSTKSMSQAQAAADAAVDNISLQATKRNKLIEENNLMKSVANSNNDHTDIDRHPSVEVYYYHSVLNVWRVVKDESVWSFAILLSLENNHPLKVMVSRGHEEESKEIFTIQAPKGMSHVRIDNLTKSVGDSKKLLSLYKDTEGDFNTSKQISDFYDLLEIEKQKLRRGRKLSDKSTVSPFITAPKAKHDNPVIRKNLRKPKDLMLLTDSETMQNNFFTKNNPSGFLPLNYQSRSALNSPKNNPLLSPVVLSSATSHPFASISGDSIDFSKSSTLNMNFYHTQQLNSLRSGTQIPGAPGVPKVTNPSLIKSIKQQQFAKSLEKSLMQTRW